MDSLGLGGVPGGGPETLSGAWATRDVDKMRVSPCKRTDAARGSPAASGTCLGLDASVSLFFKTFIGVYLLYNVVFFSVV